VPTSRPISLIASVAVLPLTALALAACGGGSNDTAASQPSSPAAARSTAKHTTTVRVAKTRLGKILVNSRGRALYLFKKDRGTKSACFGACAVAWPPLRASGKPAVGRGAKASLIGTTKRSDGKPQVTYNGHPLYTFIMDKKAGDTNGEGFTAFGGRWFAVSPAGKQVSKRASKSASGAASTPAPAPTATPAPPAPTATPTPAAKPPAASNGIPQNNGGDHDSDNNGGPDDGDGGI
jgi:predicted lipoprotein with Yx(FWY)xxD motif